MELSLADIEGKNTHRAAISNRPSSNLEKNLLEL
jgi:hypothetical protein